MIEIEIVLGNIVVDDSNAIVNAANQSLLGGGGVDGAIHAAGGPAILDACKQLRTTTLPDGLATGDAVATTAGNLGATWVIHTVGPKHWEYPDGGVALLHSCHTRSLDIAHELGARSVAFPAISCGVYGWSFENAAPIALEAVRSWLVEHPASSLGRVRFVLFDDAGYQHFKDALARG